MKCRVITNLLCITLICFSLNNIPMVFAGKQENNIKKILTNPLLISSLPEPAVRLFSFNAFILNLGEDPVSTDDLMDKLKYMDEKIDLICGLIKSQPRITALLTLQLEKMDKDEREIRTLTNFIHQQFEIMQVHVNFPSSLREDAETFTSNHLVDHLRHKWHRLVDLLTPSDSGESDLLAKLSAYISPQIKAGEWCDSQISVNEYIYRKYRSFMLAISKGFVMMERSFEILTETASPKDKYVGEVNFLRNKYYYFKNKYSKHITELITKTSLSIRRCDPTEHERNKTFLELEKFLQGYITNEFHLTSPPTGSGKCEDHRLERAYDHSEYGYSFYTKCDGYLFVCESVNAYVVCPSDVPSRRYNGTGIRREFWEDIPSPLGNITSCNDDRRMDMLWSFAALSNPEIRHRNPSDPFIRNPCRCLCDDYFNQNFLRYLDTHPVFSDYENHMVITGLRLSKYTTREGSLRQNLRIEIQQGKLGPYGYINATDVKWVKPIEYTWDSFIRLSRGFRSVNLNAINLPPDFAMIGVQLIPSDQFGGFVQLRVFARPISFETGTIMDYSKNGKLYSTHDQEEPKSELKIIKPTIPSLAAKNVRLDGKDKFVKLQPSDWEKDAAQTLVPFIDIQEVVTNPPTLLGGVDFAYRSTPGYGGFLSLELQSWNYTNHILELANDDAALSKQDGFSPVY